jgi:hypothetical protein
MALTAEQLVEVKDRIARLKLQWDACKMDRGLALECAIFLETDQTRYLVKNEGETTGHWKNKQRMAVNLASFITDRLAAMYSAEPVRRVGTTAGSVPVDTEGNPVDFSDWFSTRLWERGVYGHNPVCRDINRWVIYHGAVAVEPRYVRGKLEGDPGYVEPIYYRRHEFEVLPAAGDQRRAEAVALIIQTQTVQMSRSQAQQQRVTCHYWDAQYFARLVDWMPDTSEVNPDDPRWDAAGYLEHGLGEIPIDFIRLDRPQTQFYPEIPGIAMMSQCKTVNKEITELLHTISTQTGQPWCKGTPKSAFMGSDVLFEMPADQDHEFGILASQANLPGMIEGLQWAMDIMSVSLGMAPGSMRMDPRESQSGVALEVEGDEAERMRNAAVSTYRQFEESFFRHSLQMYQAGSMVDDLPFPLDTLSLSVSFKEPESKLGRQNLMAEVKMQLDLGLISKREAKRRLEPTLSEEEVDAQIAEAEDEVAKVKAREAMLSKNVLTTMVGRTAPPRPGVVQAATAQAILGK